MAVPQIRVRSIAPLPDGSGPILLPSELTDLSLLGNRLLDGTDEGTLYLREQTSSQLLLQLKQHRQSASPLPPAAVKALEAEMARFLTVWTVQPDLLNSTPRDAHFTIEIDDSGVAQLRFGDGTMGSSPAAGSLFLATYRVAAGSSRQFGSGVIDRLLIRPMTPEGIAPSARNPLAAEGAAAPEDVATVKLLAPGAYRNKLERAVTAADYAAIAETHSGVQRAAATLLWTGTGYEAHVAIDPLGTDLADPDLLQSVDRFLQPYRRLGHDLVVAQAEYVSLDLALQIEVAPGYLRAHVKAALLRVFSNGLDASGRPALFHPDSLTFGTSIYASKLVAAAQAVEGVVSTTITKLQRLFAAPAQEMSQGVLAIGPLEVARLDQDPAHPENGALRLSLRGGR